MKIFLLVAIAALPFIQSCKEGKSANSDGKSEMTNTQMAAPNETNDDFINMLGSYTGDFGDTKITVLLTTISKDSVKGSSIVAGNDRPFEGTVATNSTGGMVLTAKEPGSDKHDGTFTFNINSSNKSVLAGTWQPYDTAAGKAKSFNLAKKAFTYNPNDGSTDASKRLLKTEDVENEDKYSLSFMRNEIFARHGYSFSRKETRQMFEVQDWYVPRSINVTAELTDIERKNISLIKKYEKYAEEYGDDYGR